MRRWLLVLGLGVLSAAGWAARTQAEEEKGCHGTAVHFEQSPSAAARRALKEEKLVFVLHVSGHFEDPAVT